MRILVLVLVLGTATLAQAPAFDAVSIKVNTSGDTNSRMGAQAGRLIVTNATLRMVLRNVFSVSQAQIVGAPEWVNQDRFDIVATSAANPTRDQMIAMAKTMLADRFKLSARMETRDIPIYALVLARADGRLGPNLRRSTLVCDRQTPPPAGAAGPAPEPPAPLAGVAVPVCGANLGNGAFRAGGLELDALARRLGEGVDRIVLNRTGLTGAFDIVLNAGAPGATPTENVASMFTAVQEQLGLKLEPQTGPAEVLVIQHVEKPTEN